MDHCKNALDQLLNKGKQIPDNDLNCAQCSNQISGSTSAIGIGLEYQIRGKGPIGCASTDIEKLKEMIIRC